MICGFKLVLKPHVDQPTAPTTFNGLLAAAQAALTSVKGLPNLATTPTTATDVKKEEVPEKQYITTENKDTYADALNKLAQVQLEDDLLPAFISLLYPQSPYEIFLEMEEPAIDDLVLTAPSKPDSSATTTDYSKTKLSWIDWYDRLKADSEAIQTSLQ